MATKTLSELTDRAAAIADMHDGFVTPAEWSKWADAENLALSLFIARAGWTQNIVTATYTVTGSEAGEFDLTGTEPLAVVAVHQVRNGYVRPINLTNSIDFLRTAPGSTVMTGDPLEYRLLWDQTNNDLIFEFYPVPTTGVELLVSYIPHPGTVETDGVRYPMGWEERIVLGMARRALVKEESDTTEVRRLMAEMDQQIEQAVWNRVLAESPTVRNVDKARRGWVKSLYYPPAADWWWA